MNLDKWKSQIVRGTLEYCILLMLNKKVYYGYEILQELSKYPMIASTESTVYPLLRRLQKENYLQSTWQESAEVTATKILPTNTRRQGISGSHES